MKISECCGAPIPLDGEDYGICPDCKEHCEYIEEEDDPRDLQQEQDDQDEEDAFYREQGLIE